MDARSTRFVTRARLAVGWVGLGVLLVACNDREASVGSPSPAQAEVRVRVDASPATLGHADRTVSATGTVKPWRDVNLRSEVGGRVDEVAVDNGAEVEAGDLLLRVDGSRQSIAVAASDARLAASEDDVVRAKEHLDRMQTLRAARTVSAVQVEQAQHDYERAKAGQRAASADVRGARRQRRDTVVKAPIAGTVTRRSVDAGDTIGPGAPLLDLVDLTRVRITVGVSGRDLARLDRAATPTVRINDLGGQALEGVTIAALAPSANPVTGLFDVELHADNDGGEVRGGMIAAVDMSLRAGDPQVLVLRDAITRRDGALAVFEIVDGHARLRPVTTGGYDARRIEIVDGLEPGAVVATSGLHTLADGVAVEVADGAQIGEGEGGDSPQTPTGAAVSAESEADGDKPS